ncbi:hypothetical protein SteCoe_9314 [Stentor coeruleus]|uniref:Uncharacterized protein n=1 Tax=Stentor coeruleus TaxID=5963 RepID=A0A1R2CI27_9CILI|nr:hypothetical protein SteCoe_9314 [Stentor coeruleus]
MDFKGTNAYSKIQFEQCSTSYSKEDIDTYEALDSLGLFVDPENGLRRSSRLKAKKSSKSQQNTLTPPFPNKNQRKKSSMQKKVDNIIINSESQKSNDIQKNIDKQSANPPTTKGRKSIETNTDEKINRSFKKSSSLNFLIDTHNHIKNDFVDTDSSNYENFKKQINQLEEKLENSQKELLLIKSEFSNYKADIEKLNEQHNKSIYEKALENNELSIKNTELEVRVQKMIKEVQVKDMIITQNTNELDEKNKEIEILKYKIDNQKAIICSIQKNNSLLSEEYKKNIDQFEALKIQRNCENENWKKINENLKIVNKNMKDELDNKYCIEIENLKEINNAFEEEIHKLTEVVTEKSLEIHRIKNSDNTGCRMSQLENMINQLNSEKLELIKHIDQLNEHILA